MFSRRRQRGQKATFYLNKHYRAVFGLCSLNFFMADVQVGIGPFLGVFLQSHGWKAGLIGFVMTIGGLAGMVVTLPFGSFIDHTRHKRLVIAIMGGVMVAGSFMMLSSQSMVNVVCSQLATAVAGATIGPAVAGVTLGIARQKGFNAQTGRNQACNHAGTMISAALSGWLGWQFGFFALFYLIAAFSVLAIASVFIIPESSIDHRAARGWEGENGQSDGHKAESLKAFFCDKSLCVTAVVLGLFHFSNAAILPLYGMAVVSVGQGNPALFTTKTIIVAQAVMIIASLLAMRFVARWGYWSVLLMSLLALPVRGFCAGTFIQQWGVWPVQILDGVGAGLQSVAIPGLVACLLNGRGRTNIGQGFVMTAQGVGASLSPALGGWLVQDFGYSAAFYVLCCCALAPLMLWVGYGPTLRLAMTYKR